MTTNINVEAHCDENKVVLVTLSSEEGLIEAYYLRDGDKSTYHVYDDMLVSVSEIIDE